MTRRDWLWVEQRAAELGIEGWSINYWGSRGEIPRGREQWAGWLAHEVFRSIWVV